MTSRALVASVAVGITAAALVPPAEPGLGWVLAGAVAVAAICAAGPAPRWNKARVLPALGAVLLLAAGTVRAAGWLFVLCLAVAVPLASLAVAGGGGTWRRTARGAGALLVTAPRAVGWSAGALRAVDARRWLRSAVPGVLAGLALVVVFGALFASADPVFAKLLRDSVPPVSPAAVLVFLAGGLVTLSALRLRATPPPEEDDPVDRRALPRAHWVVPLALLDALFAVFVAVQVTVLFGGHGYVLDPRGPSYAEYARGGFWQLTVATALTLAVVGFVAQRARTDRVLIRLLAGPLCLLALVVVASALRRMGLYVEAYGFTRVRLVAFTVEVLLGVAFLLVLAAGVRLRAPWLPAASVTAVVAAVLTFVAIDPDAVVARTIIARFDHDRHLDAGYLSGLSADAVPEIDRLPEPYRSCVLAGLADRPSTVDPWYAVNAGRRTALRVLRERPLRPDATPCGGVFYGPHDEPT
jgi:hypothetical protein